MLEKFFAKRKVKIIAADREHLSLSDETVNAALDKLTDKNFSVDKIEYLRNDNGRLITVIIEYEE